MPYCKICKKYIKNWYLINKKRICGYCKGKEEIKDKIKSIKEEIFRIDSDIEDLHNSPIIDEFRSEEFELENDKEQLIKSLNEVYKDYLYYTKDEIITDKRKTKINLKQYNITKFLT